MSRTARFRKPLRKTAKWGGLVACALLLVVWVASSLWSLEWSARGGGVFTIAQGTISAGWLHPQIQSSFPPEFRLGGPCLSHKVFPHELLLWFWDFKGGQEGIYGISVPLWLPLLLTATIAALAWRADLLARHRARIGACAACGYALTGLPPDAPCPECGAARADAITKTKPADAP